MEMEQVLRPSRHKIGHFGDVLPSQSLDSVVKKLNSTNLTYRIETGLTITTRVPTSDAGHSTDTTGFWRYPLLVVRSM